ncbi:MAG TPA: hypothetical protein DCZ03_12315, partial [Gammaproteobacteria bacterium]|nr:hypothetical protein [Gammaproteobacteria bacterium]
CASRCKENCRCGDGAACCTLVTHGFRYTTIMSKPIAIKMPQLSDTMTEGALVSW